MATIVEEGLVGPRQRCLGYTEAPERVLPGFMLAWQQELYENSLLLTHRRRNTRRKLRSYIYQDLARLRKLHKQLMDLVVLALGTSIGSEIVLEDQLKVPYLNAALQAVTERLPAFEHGAFFDDEILQDTPGDIRAWYQNLVETSLFRCLDWLEALQAAGYLGTYRENENGTSSYSYPRFWVQEGRHRVTNEQLIDRSFDHHRPTGLQQHDTYNRRYQISLKMLHELHEHTISRVQQHPRDYIKGMQLPRRMRSWQRQLPLCSWPMVVVDGLLMDEQVREIGTTTGTVAVRASYIKMYDPAIVLGSFVFAGFGPADLGEKLMSPERDAESVSAGLWKHAAVAVAVVAGLAVLFT